MTSYGLDDRILVLNTGRNFYVHYHIQTSSRNHLALYPMGTGRSFLEDKVAKIRMHAVLSPLPAPPDIFMAGCLHI
jgi:hypothetical protein